MSPVEQALIERKLGQIVERLGYLESFVSDGFETYTGRFERRKAAEKILQELIEAAIDVNTHLLVELGGTVPRDYHHSFLEVGRRGWLPPDLMDRLAPTAGLRNRLVHQYATIDDGKVFAAMAEAVPEFTAFVAGVRRLLEQAR